MLCLTHFFSFSLVPLQYHPQILRSSQVSSRLGPLSSAATFGLSIRREGQMSCNRDQQFNRFRSLTRSAANCILISTDLLLSAVALRDHSTLPKKPRYCVHSPFSPSSVRSNPIVKSHETSVRFALTCLRFPFIVAVQKNLPLSQSLRKDLGMMHLRRSPGPPSTLSRIVRIILSSRLPLIVC